MTEIMDEDKYIVLISEEELKNFCNESVKLSDLKHKGGRFYYKDTIYRTNKSFFIWITEFSLLIKQLFV